MKNQSKFVRACAFACAGVLSALAANAGTNAIPNRLIEYDTFLSNAAMVGRLRNKRRVTEEEFIKMSAEPGTVIFDARSDDKYAGLHIQGAKHLNFSEITADTLVKFFPRRPRASSSIATITFSTPQMHSLRSGDGFTKYPHR